MDLAMTVRQKGRQAGRPVGSHSRFFLARFSFKERKGKSVKKSWEVQVGAVS